MVDPYGLSTRQPLRGIDRVLVALLERRRYPEVAREASENRLVEPNSVHHSTSKRPGISKPVPDLPSVRRVSVPPNPVVKPPVQRDSLAELCSICEKEVTPCPTSIDELLKLSLSWVHAVAMVRWMGDASADLDLGNGKRRRHNFLRSLLCE